MAVADQSRSRNPDTAAAGPRRSSGHGPTGTRRAEVGGGSPRPVPTSMTAVERGGDDARAGTGPRPSRARRWGRPTGRACRSERRGRRVARRRVVSHRAATRAAPSAFGPRPRPGGRPRPARARSRRRFLTAAGDITPERRAEPSGLTPRQEHGLVGHHVPAVTGRATTVVGLVVEVWRSGGALAIRYAGM